MLRWNVLLAAGAIGWIAPVQGQEVDIAPAPAAIVQNSIAATRTDSNVEPFYASHPTALLWLSNPDGRAAAAKLVEILKRAPIDGLAEGPLLATADEAALLSGTPEDDKIISNSWVRYVQALRRPVAGVSYGDPALQIQPPTATEILGEALSAPSLAAHIDRIAAVNPLYFALRNDAISSAQQADPHVRATLDRLRLVPASGRAILVDVANAELMMLEDGRVADQMKVIVGKADFPTPLLAGKIWYVTFNPYWHIPQDVAKRKVAPVVLKRGVAYLKAAKYQTVAAFGGDKEEPIDPGSVDWKAVANGTVEVHIRQLAGPQNMMGKMKFGFANDYGIFLHDTPHKDLFGKTKRNLSLGCVRLEHPERLASWLLGHDPVPPDDGSELNVQIDKGVPIYVSYLTARPDGEQIVFADDVYKLDSAASGTQTVATAAASAKK
jgi:murein L,D-transpeptidase YcbB/YkuD